MPGTMTGRVLRHALLAALLVPCLLSAAAAATETSWPDLREELFGARFLAVSGDVIRIDGPYRTDNDARTVVSVRLDAPEGHRFKSLQLILDENPMPVSAQLAFALPTTDFEFTATMRINGPTPVHAVAELENGQLFVAETFIKTSGQGACAAPPGTDPVKALATLGQMELFVRPGTDTAHLVRNLRNGRPNDLALDVEISHPSHSGMQRDQVTLLYIPARYVDTLQLDLNGTPFVTMTGSISLSENPNVSFSIPSGTRRVKARMTDTQGTVSEVEESLANY